jgi:hypothetical protein
MLSSQMQGGQKPCVFYFAASVHEGKRARDFLPLVFIFINKPHKTPELYPHFCRIRIKIRGDIRKKEDKSAVPETVLFRFQVQVGVNILDAFN